MSKVFSRSLSVSQSFAEFARLIAFWQLMSIAALNSHKISSAFGTATAAADGVCFPLRLPIRHVIQAPLFAMRRLSYGLVKLI